MNYAFNIKLDHADFLPTTRAGVDYQLHYSFKLISLPAQTEEPADATHGIIKVGISDVLCHTWQIKGDDLRKVLYEYARQHVIKLAEDGRLGGTSVIELRSDTSPQICPFEPSHVQMELDTPFRVLRRK